MEKYVPKAQRKTVVDSLREQMAEFDRKYRLVRVDYYIQVTNYQRDDYSGGYRSTHSRKVYGPYTDRTEAQAHVDELNADKELTRFGDEYTVVNQPIYETRA